MLTLFHWEPNQFSLKPLIALYEKGLAFESRFLDYLNLEPYRITELREDFEAMRTLEGESPVLLHDGALISDSLFINQYLDDAFPDTPLQPLDAVGRWRVQVWGRYAAEVVAPAAGSLGCARYLAPLLAGRREALAPQLSELPNPERRARWEAALFDRYAGEELDDSRRKLGLVAQKLEASLSGADWLVGDAYSLADIELFAMCNSLPKLVPEAVNAESTPRLMDWLARIRVRPAVQQALARGRSAAPDEAFLPGPEHSRWG